MPSRPDATAVALDGSESAYRDLLQFLYGSPVALVQAAPDGAIQMMTPMAVQLLMPLASCGDLRNLLDVLDGVLPRLRAQVAAFGDGHGMVAEGQVFDVPGSGLPRVVSLSLLQLHVQVPGDATPARQPQLLALLNDITVPARQARQRQQALADELTLATEAVGLGSMVVRNPDGAMRWSRQTFALHGHPHAADGQEWPVLQAALDADQRALLQQWMRSAFDNRTDAAPLDYEVCRPDGDRRWLSIRGRWLPDDDNVPRLLCAVWDVTPQHQVQAAQLARQVAEAANRAKSDFLSHMSHEFRTPLNAVLGFADVLLKSRDPELTARQRHQVGHMRMAGRLLLQMVTDLLDLARIEAGHLDIALEDVDATALALQVLQVLEPDIHTRSLQVHGPLATPDAPWVRADALRLRQVLMNLVSNAIKYNHDGGQVRVTVTRDGDRCRLAVDDTGLGLTEDQQRRLFTPFDRLGRESSGVPGTGIGLVIVRQIVLAMGGDLAVHSAAGQGSSFVVTLPLADPA